MMDINSVNTSNVVGAKVELKPIPSQPVQQVTNAKDTSHALFDLTDSGNTIKKGDDKEQDSSINAGQLEQVANDLNEMVTIMRKGLAFKVDASSDRPVVSVMDIDSGEVLRQIPSEEALALAEKLSEVTGSLIKTEV